MGKKNSKLTTTPSFDQIKTVRKSIDIRQKNQPNDYQRPSTSVEEDASASIDKSSIHLVENMILVWLDASTDKQGDNTKNFLAQLRRICNVVRPFSETQKCLDFVRSIYDEKILFVVSGSLGPEILPHINHLDQIYSIYIFCGKKSNHIEWSKPFDRIHGIHTQMKELCEALRYDFNQYDKSLTAVSILPASTEITLNASTKQFIYLQVLKCILLEIDYLPKFRRELVEYVQPFYLQNSQQLNVISTFEENYVLHSPIWWYTRKGFLYQMLRKAFYEQDFEIIYKLAFFIRDLHREIKKAYLQIHSCQYHPICLYRAARMTKAEFENLERNQDGLLAFNDFVTTTLERVIALKFAQKLRNDPQTIAIIYKIDIDPAKSSIPFIAFNNLTYLNGNRSEIFLSMNTIFHIDTVEKVVDRLYEVSLVPASKKDNQIVHLVDYMQEITCGLSGWYKLSKIMMEVEEYDQVEHIYKYIYDQVGEDQQAERAYILHELGCVFESKNDLETANFHYRRALEIYTNHLSVDHPTLLSTYINLAGVLQKLGNLNEALTFYQQALKVDKSDDPLLIAQYNNIGLILQKQGKHSEAQQSFLKAIDILKRDFPLPSGQKILADSYHYLAGLLFVMKDYSLALTYYEKLLLLSDKSISSELAILQYNIATTYDGLRDGKKAIQFVEKSIETARETFDDIHRMVKDNQAYLEHLYEKYSFNKL